MYLRLTNYMFLTFSTPAYHLGFCRSTEFERVALLVLLNEHLDDINVFFERLHLGEITDITTKAQICELVQIKLIITLGRTLLSLLRPHREK